MVRGCQRRVVFLKNTDSSVFSEAYFILTDNDNTRGMSDEDMIREANRIIDESVGIREREPIGKTLVKILIYSVIPFVVGIGIGILINF